MQAILDAAAPVPEEIRPLPRHAPHAALWLTAAGGTAGQTRIETTLDRGLQLLAECHMRAVRGDQVLSRGAAYLTRRALARRDRPDFPSRRRLSGAPAAIHWKTGTSYGLPRAGEHEIDDDDDAGLSARRRLAVRSRS